MDVEHRPNEAGTVEEDAHFVPRGAFLFSMAMLVGFAIYMIVVYLTVIGRGG
jgi:hypothetical protein